MHRNHIPEFCVLLHIEFDYGWIIHENTLHASQKSYTLPSINDLSRLLYITYTSYFNRHGSNRHSISNMYIAHPVTVENNFL